jgi:hypothetical protein
MRRTNKTGDERQELGEPPTPGLAASPPAESNFLSVGCRPASLGPFVIGMENQHGEFGWQPA